VEILHSQVGLYLAWRLCDTHNQKIPCTASNIDSQLSAWTILLAA